MPNPAPRSKSSIPQVGDAAPNATVLTLSGAPASLATLWLAVERGLALVFLRHYGCPFCREHARDINAHQTALRHAGVAVAMIGCGTADQARAFRDELRLDIPVFNDPGRDAYAAYGLGSANPITLLHPLVIGGGMRAAIKGYLPRRPQGDPFQLQGLFLIARDGTLLHASRPSLMSDIPSATDLAATARTLPWS